MLAALSEQDRHAAWQEIEAELGQFETDGRFEGPCELLIAAGVR